MTRKLPRNVTLSPDVVAAMEAIASAERRTFSNVADLLIAEAIEAREAARPVAVQS